MNNSVKTPLDNHNDFDFIIVGAGSAGCILANRLTESGRYRVLLVEAGPADKNPWIHVPIGYAKTFFDPKCNWMYNTEPDLGINNRSSYWPRGKVLGGSSSINAMVFIRGQHADFDDWEIMGASGWGWADVLPYFKKLENIESGGDVNSDVLRGKNGPISVSRIGDSVHPTNRNFLAGCAELGFPRNPDFNGPSQEGVNHYQINTSNGLRVSASRAYLRPAAKRKNLQVVTNAHVTRLNFEGAACIGITYFHKGSYHEVRAHREVVLSAGSVNTPQILQCSGIGDQSLLGELGISVQHHAPLVGENLQDHIGLSYFFRSRVPTLNNEFTSMTGCVRAGLRYLLTRKGPLSISVNHSGGFVRSSPARARPNIQLYFQPTSYMNAPTGTRPMIALDKFAALSIGISQCRPTSRGHIKIGSADPLVAPKIVPNYLSTEYDVNEMIEGVKLIRKIAGTDAMKKIIVEEMVPGGKVLSDEALIEDFRNRCGTIFHPVSTCAMGRNSDSAVVDPRLKVYGVNRLRIVDASIFPTVTSGNTNAPVMMVAEKASDMILEDQ